MLTKKKIEKAVEAIKPGHGCPFLLNVSYSIYDVFT